MVCCVRLTKSASLPAVEPSFHLPTIAACRFLEITVQAEIPHASTSVKMQKIRSLSAKKNIYMHLKSIKLKKRLCPSRPKSD